MLNFYYYDTGTGRVLATGSYDERGDGAAARALGVGVIDPATEYAPGGVKTSRPVFTPALTISRQTLLADATDSVTVSNIPAGTVAKIYKDQDKLPRSIVTVNDGSLVVKVDTAGFYQILLSKFPNLDQTFLVSAA